MKRKILFKGKSVNTGKWVKSMTIANGTIKRKRNDVFMEIGENKWDGIHPNSLSQNTGFKMNDVELYEGDTFHYTKHKGYLLTDFDAQVVWIEESGGWGYKVKDDPFNLQPSLFAIHDELQHDFLDHCEITGNIYEK